MLLSFIVFFFQSSLVVLCLGKNKRNITSESDCTIVDRYLHHNASSSYSIAGIDVSNGTMRSSPNKWIITTTIEQVLERFTESGKSPQDEEAVDLEIFLDTSNTRYDTLAEQPKPYAGCATKILGLSQSVYARGTNDRGFCNELFSTDCVDDLGAQLALQAAKIATTNQSLNDSCTAWAQSAQAAPSSCRQFTQIGLPDWTQANTASESDTPSFVPSDASYSWNGSSLTSYVYPAIDFTPINISTCPSAPTDLPIPIGGGASLGGDTQGTYTTYDSYAQMTTPLLIAFFSNNTIWHGNPFSNSTIMCVRPRNIAGGSRVPTSRGEQGVALDVKMLLALVIILNMGMVIWM